MKHIFRILLTFMLVTVTGAAVFASGFITGRYTTGDPLLQLAGPGDLGQPSGSTPADAAKTFVPFWQAWDFVHAEYVDQPVDDVKLMRGAISGMMEALGDPHSAYMDPITYEFFQTSLSGELEGIGAMVEQSGDYARVVSPLPGSPAEKVGVRPGDLIVQVDGEDVAGLDYLLVVGKVRGKAGTAVQLTIQREGEPELLKFDIVRARITIPSVEHKGLAENIAYVKINDFGTRTPDELRKALGEVLAQEPVGLVLDLRGNPGGLLTTAIEVASQFISEGVVMREQFGDEREETYEASGGGLATEVPLVVLIDKGSASAAEIVAGAIQDLERGTIVGETSYGKGSVQLPHELSGTNGAVRVTVARWLTPDGRSIHQEGITPDVAVELTEEDRAAELDPQLDKAIELLTRQSSTKYDSHARSSSSLLIAGSTLR